jgi:hypothetical protein
MEKWVIPASVAAIAAVWLVGSSAQASTSGGSTGGGSTGGGSTGGGTTPAVGAIVPGGPQFSAYDATQQRWIIAIVAEAKRQGVPVELALATGEVESSFRDVKATNGNSYGPMQVHVSALLSGETVTDLKNPAFSIPRGVQILRQRLVKAKGDSLLARIMYFCGPGYATSCSDEAIARLKSRWAPAVSKWKVKAHYSV